MSRKTWGWIVVILLGVVAFAGESKFMQLVDEAKQNIEEIDVSRLKKMRSEQKNLLIVDIREKVEWDAGHLEGAEHISRGILEWQIEQKVPDTHTHIVLYCGGGNRSALSAESLQKMGYRSVYSLVGGYKAILEAGMDVSK